MEVRKRVNRHRRPSIFSTLCSLFLVAVMALALPSCRPGGEAGAPPVRVSDELRQAVEQDLAGLDAPVTLRLYLGGQGEREAEETRALLAAMAEVSEPLTLEVRDLGSGPGAAGFKEMLDVGHGPVIEIEGPAAGPVWFYGLPERKELKPFLDGILTAAGRPVDLPAGVEEFLAGLDRELLIRIFTTPD